MIAALLRKMKTVIHIRRDPVGYARSLGVRVGDDCRLLGLTELTFGSEPYLIKLGNHVTVTAGVEFVTHDGGVWVFRERCPDIDIFAPIIVGSNVFLGARALILPGVTIGDNSIIGAGAIVTRDIPAGSVAVGVPARVISTVEDYWKKIESKSFHIRSLSSVEKRRILTGLFFGDRT